MATAKELIDQYPRLYHMAEQGSWDSIQRHGLLSTTALLDLFEKSGCERMRLESEWRPRSVSIEHEEHGTAVIRDQRPMPPDALKAVLKDATPSEWYKLINRKTFFWPTQERLRRLLNAQLYRGRAHDVIIVDTRALVELHQDDITLSRINSGFALFRRGRRGSNTFKSIKEYQHKEVVEVAVEYLVPNIADLAVSVEQWKGSALQEVVWQR